MTETNSSMTHFTRPSSQFKEYKDRYETIAMERTSDGILTMRFHTDGGPLQWSLQAHYEFEDAFAQVGRDRENDVIILTGTGDAFSGPAIKPGSHPNRNSMTPSHYDPILWEGKHLLPNLLSIEAPVIAAINGPAVRHAEIPLLSDIVLATDSTYFQDTAHFAGGMVPGDGMHIVMPLLMGLTRGRYFLYTGQKIEAAEAKDLGLVNEILPEDQLLERAQELAAELLKQPRLVRRYTRTVVTETLREQMHGLLGYGLALEGLARMREN
ncbi:enoyl-CoA hydratase/carnithine racemase [Streptomyces sp. SAI-135]|nr:enoyl-CoA hydratase/carnithine racemase [Streptomyces sp. SAI-090]MDH6554485.1 enoyl-CoA hydratase/carnithine racemase [Streptomyces sp. SAI-041]MDH6573752.1 enoyl-CoA hydratase/carnithine racemase [Streptomyces sp. SAI-117]MDH6581516.1 enoyl-CoA hydratase/carnithine racemase [Streptomyces sp. SAI-133]MDH6613520.1 enoyl-CoA hydratase/carnithine racemase [Streptomyces sp. SAI-135]